jgi:hypothetical protein
MREVGHTWKSDSTPARAKKGEENRNPPLGSTVMNKTAKIVGSPGLRDTATSLGDFRYGTSLQNPS